MSNEENKEKKNNPKHTKFYKAPKSGTIIPDGDPSSPENLSKDGPKDSLGEAPESGTMRKNRSSKK